MSQQERIERLLSITKEAFNPFDGAYCGTTVKDLRWLLEEFKATLAELTKEREANKVLQWYADQNNYKSTEQVRDYRKYISKVQKDAGERARTILEGNEPNEGIHNSRSMD